MRNKVYSYVPEKAFLKRTDHPSAQIFGDACVLFDPEEEFRVVACRGDGLAAGTRWDRVLALGEDETTFLRECAPQNSLSLIYGNGGAWLILSAFYSTTGLLLGIRPFTNGEAFCQRMAQDRLFAVAMSPAALEAASRGRGADALSLEWSVNVLHEVSDILRHFSRMERSFDLADHVCWLARFAGCPVEERSSIRAAIPPSLSAKLTVYLLCLFLALQGRGGRLLTSKAATGASFDAGLALEWSVLGEENARTRVDPAALADFPEFDFLFRPCFRPFRLEYTPQGLSLRLPVLPPSYRLRARAEQRVVSLLISGLPL